MKRSLASVVVCTLDRGTDLRLTVESLLGQDHPSDRFEVVLVDNGSMPENAAEMRRFARERDPAVRYVREDTIGLSVARNRGIREARGETVVFLDDDAIAAPGWLGAIVRAFDDDPRLAAVGGRVVLRYLADPPAWVDASLALYLSGFDLGPTVRELRYPDYPRGANMAFRRNALAAAGGFSERFGRKGASLLSCEETELCWHIEQGGGRIRYLPDASVDHLVPAGRLRREWFARRIYWQGRSLALFERCAFGRLRLLARIPGQLLGLLRKRGLHRRIHLGYLAAVPGCLLVARDVR